MGLQASVEMVEILSQYINRHPFTESDAAVVEPLLASDADYAAPMAKTVLEAFRLKIKDVVATGPSGSEKPWLQCIGGRNASQTQQKLAGDTKALLMQWVKGNPLAFSLQRAVELLQAVGLGDPSTLPELCCLVFTARKNLAKSEGLLAENEITLLNGAAFQQMDDTQRDQLAACL